MKDQDSREVLDRIENLKKLKHPTDEDLRYQLAELGYIAWTDIYPGLYDIKNLDDAKYLRNAIKTAASRLIKKLEKAAETTNKQIES